MFVINKIGQVEAGKPAQPMMFCVGHYPPAGGFVPLKATFNREEAMRVCHYLNGDKTSLPKAEGPVEPDELAMEGLRLLEHDGYSYITKDKDGKVYANASRPTKGPDCWIEPRRDDYLIPDYIYGNIAELVSWSDPDPLRISDILPTRKGPDEAATLALKYWQQAGYAYVTLDSDHAIEVFVDRPKKLRYKNADACYWGPKVVDFWDKMTGTHGNLVDILSHEHPALIYDLLNPI